MRLYFWRCLSVCLSVCLLTTLRKNFRTDLHEIFREGWQWAIEQVVTFWWRSESPSGYRDCFPDSSLLRDIRKVINGHSFILIRQMAALVRYVLVEVCTVPVLLVNHIIVFLTSVCSVARLFSDIDEPRLSVIKSVCSPRPIPTVKL